MSSKQPTINSRSAKARALRELKRDIDRIPDQGDFSAGKRLQSLLRAACLEAAGQRGPWRGVLFHRSFGPVDLIKTAADEIIVEVRATRHRLRMVPGGRSWERA